LEACAKNSGAHCKARAKFPETVLRRLVTELARGCENQLPKMRLWRGKHVVLCDGCMISMPDTEEDQAEYPQPESQAKGLGFPILRMVVLFSLATAMLLDQAIAPNSGKETGEMALLRQLLGQLPEEIQTEATNLETEREKREQARCKVEQTRIPSEATKKAMLDLAEGYARLSEIPGGLMHHTIDTLLQKIIPLLAEPYAQRREERDELRTITETFTSGMKDLTDEFRQQLAEIHEAQKKNFAGLLALVDSLQRLLPPQTKRTLELPSPALRPR
jgi:hypothetical protein